MKFINLARHAARVRGWLCAAAALTFSQPAAARTVFTLMPITINGSANVDAVSINDAGSITGTVDGNGFMRAGGRVWMLPGSDCAARVGCGPWPGLITRRGDIAGSNAAGETFVVRAGRVLPRYGFALGGADAPVVLLNDHGAIAFATAQGIGSASVFAGVPPAVVPVAGLDAGASLAGLNDSNVLSGSAPCGTGGALTQCVFAGKDGDFIDILPPGAASAAGGVVNAAGQVAGSYVDSAGQHGFVFHARNYTSFDMPQAAVLGSVAVMGISDAGRVIGTYIDAAQGLRHVFWFNGTTVSAFGAFPAADTVTVALNAATQAVVADLHDGAAASTLVTCQGAGC